MSSGVTSVRMKAILLTFLSFFSTISIASIPQSKLAIEFSENGFKNIEVSTIPASDLYTAAELSGAKHFIQPSFVLFRDTGWTKAQAVSHLKEIARIYNSKTCRIFIKEALIVESDPYLDIKDIDWASIYTLPGIKGADMKIADQFPKDLSRPVIAFVRSVLYPADAAFSAAAFKAGDDPSYVNSTWIPARVNEVNYIKQLPPGYDPIAHELAHLLGNTGHNTLSEPNILNDDFNKINDQILPEQCDAFLKSNLVL